MFGADAAGYAHFTVNDIGKHPAAGSLQLGVAVDSRQHCHSGVEIARPHGVSSGLANFSDRNIVLRVNASAVFFFFVIAAAVNKKARERKMLLIFCMLIKL